MLIKLAWQPGKITWVNCNLIQRIDYRASKYLRLKLVDGQSMSVTHNEIDPSNVDAQYSHFINMLQQAHYVAPIHSPNQSQK